MCCFKSLPFGIYLSSHCFHHLHAWYSEDAAVISSSPFIIYISMMLRVLKICGNVWFVYRISFSYHDCWSCSIFLTTSAVWEMICVELICCCWSYINNLVLINRQTYFDCKFIHPNLFMCSSVCVKKLAHGNTKAKADPEQPGQQQLASCIKKADWWILFLL